MKRICLISCVSKKQLVAVPAKDLYLSALYKKSVAWMNRQNFDSWFILSAKHGLVKPDDILAPYDQTLNNARVAVRRQWAKDVLAELRVHIPEPASITFLADSKYCEYLITPLQEAGYEVNLPMKGLGIGKRLQWLGKY